MNKLINKIKEISNQIYLACTVFVSSLYAMPTFAFAEETNGNSGGTTAKGADLLNAKLLDNGKLQITGAVEQQGIKGTVNAFTQIMNVARTVVSGITGLISIALIAVLAMKAFQLSKCGDNPSERAKITQGIIWYFIAVVLFGATSLLTGVFYNMLH